MQAHQYSDFHRLIWICGIIGTLGTAVGVCYGLITMTHAVINRTSEMVQNILAIKVINQKADETARVVAATKEGVDLIQSNHLAHVESGIADVARTNLELVGVTKEIRDGIIKLVDRGERSL